MLGEMINADPKLKSRVIVTKVRRLLFYILTKTLNTRSSSDDFLTFCTRFAVQCNADAHGELGSRFDVKGFPTIKFFPRGAPATKENAQE